MSFPKLLFPVLVAMLWLDAVPAEPERDAEVERRLREGRVIRIEDVGSGLTRPKRVTLELDGQTVDAAFKTVNISEQGVTRFPDGTTEIGFTDRYRYERAAYLLDRRLGLDMVPVTVLRSIEGQKGALVRWVDDATSETERKRQTNVLPEALRHQQALMRLFDALIFNVDRHTSNQLITADSKLHLIDHSRSFRKKKTLPPEFVRMPASTTRSVLKNLELLAADQLRELFDESLTGVEIKFLLKRRDRIVEKIRADQKEFGEDAVFHEPFAP